MNPYTEPDEEEEKAKEEENRKNAEEDNVTFCAHSIFLKYHFIRKMPVL